MYQPLQIRSFIGTHDKDWEDPSFFRHDSLEITVILEGRGLFRYQDRQFDVDTGQVVLIPSDFPHSFHAVTAIRFGVLLMDGLPMGTRVWFDKLITGNVPRIISLSRLDREQYELLFRQWLRIYSAPLKEREENYLTWIQVLSLFIYEHSQSEQQALSITYAADYIRQNLQRGIQISDLAQIAGLSEEGFRKQFHKVYGMTPKRYQQKSKLTEAKWLLSSSDKDMQSISELIGFSGLHAFSGWFKKLEGQSPTEWKKLQRMYHH
ncbi:helix-turn-helix domain-containing protein [Paenibacillus alba]|uniref:AraC family transcriptional regulator n=1 Tax=Paenibacillus alba TaxID=1197127 RepID=A0ABU6G0B6_9BACL|nr:AraC family transcriptional regulator [Paenibacillus alba]MEC0227601.1 AraC family transcriptional regulator [Paenibacillus alba]